MASEGNDEFNSVIESLMNMFSGVLNRDAILTVAESCGGDCKYSTCFSLCFIKVELSLLHVALAAKLNVCIHC